MKETDSRSMGRHDLGATGVVGLRVCAAWYWVGDDSFQYFR